MKAMPGRTQRKPVIIPSRDEEILRVIYQYRYMTALDVAWLLFKPTSHTRTGNPLVPCRWRRFKHSILSLSVRVTGGRQCPADLYAWRQRPQIPVRRGLPDHLVLSAYKFGRLTHSHLFHSCLLTRCVVAAHVWARKQSEFHLIQVRFGHALSAAPGRRVGNGEAKTAPVIPDAWLLFERVSNGNQLPVMLELDRGREQQKRFKDHIRSRIKFIEDGSYTRLFGSRSVGIYYATTGEIPAYRDTRCQTMRRWTNEVLAELGKQNWAGVFRFASTVYQDLYDLTLFEKPVWYRPDSSEPLSFLRS
jgi:hypothetical protein